MAKSKIPKTPDRHGTDRELYLKELTTFLRNAGKQPVAELIDTVLLDGVSCGTVGALAWDERTHELYKEFSSTSDSISELLKGPPGVPDETKDQVRRRLEDLWGTYMSSTDHIAEMMLNSTADFFISVQVVSLLKDLTAYLEERGGAA